MEEEDSANGGDLGLEVLVEGAPVKSADCAGSEEEGTVSESSVVKQSRAEILLGMMFPQLTLNGGSHTLTMRRSVLVIFTLYTSHSFSAWGDRMWGFVLSLFLVYLYPGSLLLPGVAGVMVQLLVAVFGTLVGDWVDSSPRMRVVWVSLLIQNGLLTLCSILLALMFALDWTVCNNIVVFASLIPLVIVLGAGANLATIANTISIEKDWIVVLADKQKDTLAVLNSNMRRIDLCCKLLAPFLTGVVLQWAGPLVTTLFVAGWNILSFFAELGLIWLVYRLIPPLAIKKLRKKSEVVEVDNDETKEDGEDSLEPIVVTTKVSNFKSKANKICSKLLTPVVSLKNGWRTYIRQEIALVGFAMACIYLTVLGFSGVTSAYFLTQGVPNYLIGVCQGVGAVFGVLGTIIYPFLRKKFGTVRTGLFGISTQLAILMICVAAVFVPSHRVENNASGYYSPVCDNNETSLCFGTECNGTGTEFWTTDVVSPTATQSISASTSHISAHVQPTPTPPPPSQESQVNVAVILLLVGVVGCRIGLWTFDLAVQQLIQEKVVEEERGVVGGVMNAMNSIMDMLHYVLVIAAPRPEHFGWLTLISVAMVTLGLVLYGAYIRKSRGHFFHFRDFYRRVKKCVEKRRNISDQQVGGVSSSFIREDAVQLLSETDNDDNDNDDAL